MEPITTSVMSTACSAAGRAISPLLLRKVRNLKERQDLKKRAETASFKGLGAVKRALGDISPADRAKIIEFTQSAEFENLCFETAIAGCMPERPEEYLSKLRHTLRLALRRYAGVADPKIEVVADALFDDVCVISWREVSKRRREGSISEKALTSELIASHIAAATRNAELHSQIADLARVDAFADQLSKQCANIHGRIRPAQTESGTRVPFDDLYVEPDLALSNQSHNRPLTTNSVRDLLAQSHRLVVLGDPGGGKSTLALKMTIDIARGRGLGVTRQTPFLVILRDYALHYRDSQKSIVEYIERQAKSYYSVRPPEDGVEYLLLNGRAVVVFDGLDELTDTTLRRQIVDAVEAFAHAYPTTPILATSRRVGYEMAPLDDELFVTSYLSPFSRTQQQAYVCKWFRRMPGSVDEDRMADRFIAESAHASDLVSNPLMLGLMCALYRGEGYIPRNRPDLYRRCSEFLFERWDASRGISVSKPFERGIQFAMFSLALSMLKNSSQGPGLTERELIRFTSDYLLSQQYEDRDSADEAAEAFVRYCRGRAWVLTDVGTNPTGERIYSFTHRTFLEYFSARQLVRDSGNAASLYSELSSHLKNESWDVTAQLAVQFLDERLGDAANDFVTLCLTEAKDVEDKKHKVALVSFCARLVEFVVLRPAVVREIVADLRDVGVPEARIWRGNGDASAAWAGISMCPEETRRVVTDALIRPAGRECVNFDEMRWAISMSEFVPNHASDAVKSFWAQQDRDNAKQSAGRLIEFAKEDSRAAAAGVLFGIVSISDAVRWHGTSFVVTESGYKPTDRRGRNIISELAHPRLRWRHEGIKDIARDVASFLITCPTPWSETKQGFIQYSISMSRDPDFAACEMLTWILGLELEIDSKEVSGGGEIDSRFNIDRHFEAVAEVRKGTSTEERLDVCRARFRPEFFDFVSRWARGEFRLSGE